MNEQMEIKRHIKRQKIVFAPGYLSPDMPNANEWLEHLYLIAMGLEEPGFRVFGHRGSFGLALGELAVLRGLHDDDLAAIYKKSRP